MPWAPWELALCPSSPGVSPALHVANHLIMSGCTDWNSTCVQGEGEGETSQDPPQLPVAFQTALFSLASALLGSK